MEKYKLYQSELIKNNHPQFESQCKKVHSSILQEYNTDNSTWAYEEYNIFNLTSSSLLFYNLYKELNYHIRSFVGDNRPLWISSWLNYDEGKKVEENLHSHYHEGLYHGYISITPQNTNTMFNNGVTINNKIGQIYIGPGNNYDYDNKDWDHYVKITKPYNGVRITLGFDLFTSQNKNLNKTFIPLL
jgi:hypothetical protein